MENTTLTAKDFIEMNDYFYKQLLTIHNAMKNLKLDSSYIVDTVLNIREEYFKTGVKDIMKEYEMKHCQEDEKT